MARYKLDEVDHQILDLMIDNTRTPFTDIAKQLNISAGTVHVRVRKMEDRHYYGLYPYSRLQSIGVYFYRLCRHIFRA